MNTQDHNLFQRIRDGITVSRYPLFREYVVKQSGFTERYLYTVMKGETANPAIKVLQAIARWFGCSTDQVLDPGFVLSDTGAIKCKKSVQDSLGEGDLERIFFDKEAA